MLIPLLPRESFPDEKLSVELRKASRCGQVIIDVENIQNFFNKDKRTCLKNSLEEALHTTNDIILGITLKREIPVIDVIDVVNFILNEGVPYIILRGFFLDKLPIIQENFEKQATKRIILDVTEIPLDENKGMLKHFGGAVSRLSIDELSCMLNNNAKPEQGIWNFFREVPKKFVKAIQVRDKIDYTDSLMIELVSFFQRRIFNVDNPVHIFSSVLKVTEVELAWIARCFHGCLITDRDDGLVATIVADEYDSALGLVYSSLESIVESVKSGLATYFSRSRQGLWKKGETSGCTQLLLKIAFDCDGDALKFNVYQQAGKNSTASFCHQDLYSCFTNRGNMGLQQNTRNISGLFRLLLSRRDTLDLQNLEGVEDKTDKEKIKLSYTHRLLSNLDMLEKKLLEESQEVIEAVKQFKEEIKHHAIAEKHFSYEDRLSLNHPMLSSPKVESLHREVHKECADLFYFLATACASSYGDMAIVISELDKRHYKTKRRPGNTKSESTNKAISKLQN